MVFYVKGDKTMGILLREFGEHETSWGETLKNRIIASSQWLNTKYDFPKGKEHFINTLQTWMEENNIPHIYLSKQHIEIIWPEKR